MSVTGSKPVRAVIPRLRRALPKSWCQPSLVLDESEQCSHTRRTHPRWLCSQCVGVKPQRRWLGISHKTLAQANGPALRELQRSKRTDDGKGDE